MPKIANDLGPIRYKAVTGPALDAWNGRKEDNNSGEASSKNFRSNFANLKDRLLQDWQGIIQNAAR